MEYKNYSAAIEFDEDMESFRGSVLGLNDVIDFYGNNPKELKREFKKSVDEYLAFCKEMKKQPEKTYSGNFVLRISPETHRKVSLIAAKKGLSLNSLLENMLERNLPDLA